MERVKITIIAEGSIASGKSLAIADMIRGIVDNNHFLNHLANDKVAHTIGKETREFSLQLRRQSDE